MKISELMVDLGNFRKSYGDVEVVWRRDIDSTEQCAIAGTYGLPQMKVVCLSKSEYTDVDLQGAEDDGPRKQDRFKSRPQRHHTV